MESRKIITLITLVVVTAVNSAKKGTCPVKYARFSTQHSFCLNPNPKCNILKEGVDKEDRKLILGVYNELRSKVATGHEERAGGLPTATDMLQMEWDHELASIAQKWASQCIYNHECKDCRTVENFKVGQNVGLHIFPCSSNDCIQYAVIPNWEGIIRRFYSEVRDFNKQYISPLQYNSSYGHFTKLIWAKSWRVGCGYVAFKDESIVRKLYVCNYGPDGNYIGASVYKPGKKCSACPSNTCCGTCRVQGPTYPGLCKVRNLSLGPVYERMKDAILDCNWRNEISQCGVKVYGKNSWSVKRSLSGSYVSIQLKPGENSTLLLSASVQPKTSSFCVIVLYRKGPLNAGDRDWGTVSLVRREPGSRVSLSISHANDKDFRYAGLNYPENAKTEIELEVFVHPYASTQHIFDIKEIVAYEGTSLRCHPNAKI